MHLCGIAQAWYAYGNEDGEPHGLSTATVYAEMARPPAARLAAVAGAETGGRTRPLRQRAAEIRLRALLQFAQVQPAQPWRFPRGYAGHRQDREAAHDAAGTNPSSRAMLPA